MDVSIRLKQDLEILAGDNKIVVSFAQLRDGHVVLWFDKKGYTVTSRGYYPTSIHVGPATPWIDAACDYMRAVSNWLMKG